DVSLSVDIDGYDVSAFARIDGSRLLLDLEIPLTAGQHALSVFLFYPDGRAEVVVEASLDAPEIPGTEWSFNTLFQTNYRADEKPTADYDGIGSVTNTGSMSFQVESRSGGWRTGAAIDSMYNGNSRAAAGDDDWLLPNYELYAAYGWDAVETVARTGNITVPKDDLLFSSYGRRGSTLEAAAKSGRFSLQAFDVSSVPRNDFGGGTGDKTSGVAGTLTIVDGHLQIGGGFVDGKTSFDGAGFNVQNDAIRYGGDSWNLSLDSWLLEDSVWLHVERAESDFDADGIGIGLPASTDDATQALLQMSSSGKLGSGPFEYWSTIFEYKSVGRDFYALGNMSLPGNIEINSARFQGGFSSLVIDIDITTEQTNPNDDPLLPTQTLERTGANFAYAPVILNADNRLWQLVGSPSLNGWIYRIDNSQPDSDALFAGFDVDNRTDDAGISLAFSRDKLNWSVEYGVVDYDDTSSAVIEGGNLVYEPLSDSRNQYMSLTASWIPGERVSVDAYLQRNNLEETDLQNEYRTTNYGISGNFILMPNKMSLFLSFSQGSDRNRFVNLLFAPEHFESRFASLQLNWRVSEAAGSRPALDVFVKGNYSRNENLVAFIQEDFRAIYLGASLSWVGSK
ncbi:MAG: hypothetical protein GWP02_01210, partial [Desulfobulbaceae bacterium]|nr:hypothetical protein [Desulfobulbaceae bacterium]